MSKKTSPETGYEPVGHGPLVAGSRDGSTTIPESRSAAVSACLRSPSGAARDSIRSHGRVTHQGSRRCVKTDEGTSVTVPIVRPRGVRS